jgi:serine/threonine protein kinase
MSGIQVQTRASATSYTPILIGSGQYGCVIKPPFKFKEGHVSVEVFKSYENPDKYTDISKIFITNRDIDDIDEARYEFGKEMRELAFINNIVDPYHNFTVEYKGSNRVPYNILLTDSEIIEGTSVKFNGNALRCTRIKKGKYINQIILGYGGVNLDKASYSISYYDFLISLKRFVDGIKTLIDKGLIHQDIKPANILYSPVYIQSTRPHRSDKVYLTSKIENKLSLIDFGLSTNLKTVYTLQNLYLSEVLYKYHPPEYCIIARILSNINSKEDYKGSDLINELDKIIAALEEGAVPDKETKVNLRKYYTDIYLRDSPMKTFADYETIVGNFFDGLSDFVKHIRSVFDNDVDVNKNIDHDTMKTILTLELAKKIDIFPLSYIINVYYVNVSNKSDEKEEFIKSIIEQCYRSNPNRRVSIEELQKTLELEITKNTILASKSRRRPLSTSPSTPSLQTTSLSAVPSQSTTATRNSKKPKINGGANKTYPKPKAKPKRK